MYADGAGEAPPPPSPPMPDHPASIAHASPPDIYHQQLDNSQQLGMHQQQPLPPSYPAAPPPPLSEPSNTHGEEPRPPPSQPDAMQEPTTSAQHAMSQEQLTPEQQTQYIAHWEAWQQYCAQQSLSRDGSQRQWKEEAAKQAVYAAKIKRDLTSILLQVTDQLFDEIAHDVHATLSARLNRRASSDHHHHHHHHSQAAQLPNQSPREGPVKYSAAGREGVGSGGLLEGIGGEEDKEGGKDEEGGPNLLGIGYGSESDAEDTGREKEGQQGRQGRGCEAVSAGTAALTTATTGLQPAVTGKQTLGALFTAGAATAAAAGNAGRSTRGQGGAAGEGQERRRQSGGEASTSGAGGTGEWGVPEVVGVLSKGQSERLTKEDNTRVIAKLIAGDVSGAAAASVDAGGRKEGAGAGNGDGTAPPVKGREGAAGGTRKAREEGVEGAGKAEGRAQGEGLKADGGKAKVIKDKGKEDQRKGKEEDRKGREDRKGKEEEKRGKYGDTGKGMEEARRSRDTDKGRVMEGDKGKGKERDTRGREVHGKETNRAKGKDKEAREGKREKKRRSRSRSKSRRRSRHQRRRSRSRSGGRRGRRSASGSRSRSRSGHRHRSSRSRGRDRSQHRSQHRSRDRSRDWSRGHRGSSRKTHRKRSWSRSTSRSVSWSRSRSRPRGSRRGASRQQAGKRHGSDSSGTEDEGPARSDSSGRLGRSGDGRRSKRQKQFSKREEKGKHRDRDKERGKDMRTLSIHVAAHGTLLQDCFSLSTSLKVVAQHFKHDSEKQTIHVKMSHGGFNVMALNTCLSQLLEDGADGDGSQDRPFCVLVQRSGPRLTQEERVQALLHRFAPQLRRRLKVLPEKAAKRSGCIEGVFTSAGTVVQEIGQHFALHGLEAPVRQLFQLLYDMDIVHSFLKGASKPALHPHILKLVAAPGMGKTTALTALWLALYDFVFKRKDVVSSVLKARRSHLHERVFNSLQPHQPLVFTLDLSENLKVLVHEEHGLLSHEILALRMLLSTLWDKATLTDYAELLQALGQLMPLVALQPLDVLLFVQAAMGLKEQYSMAVFAFDEVNAVPCPPNRRASWVQDALSSFVDLCTQAGRSQLMMMPVAIIASTLASATSLHQTASGQSIVAEVQLLPLSYRDMKSILVDVCQRVGQHWGSGDNLDAPVKQLLKFTYGIPRFLAWAIHCMSDDPTSVYHQNLKLVLKDQEPCPWLRKLQLPLHGILARLVDAVSHRPSTAAWLTDDVKAKVMAQILAHAVLERKVVRSASITATIRWQNVENAGLCSLLHTGASIPVSSPAGSPHSSTGQASGSSQPEALSHSDLGALLDGSTKQRTKASDISSEYAVFVCPLLVIAAMKGLRVNETQLSVLPLVQHLADLPRMREYTDLTVFMHRLELARAVLGLKVLPLRELLPSEAQLPKGFQGLQILVPEPRSDKRYKQQGTFRTAEEFQQHCINSVHSSTYAYIGRGADKAPDSWLVLQTVDGGLLVVFVQSKKRQGRVREVRTQGLDAEAEKCWGRDTEMKRLLVYVTDERTTEVPPLYEAQCGLSVVVIGRLQQDSFYSHAVALTKRCLEWDEQSEKQP